MIDYYHFFKKGCPDAYAVSVIRDTLRKYAYWGFLMIQHAYEYALHLYCPRIKMKGLLHYVFPTVTRPRYRLATKLFNPIIQSHFALLQTQQRSLHLHYRTRLTLLRTSVFL